MGAIFKRELRSYFTGVIGYVFLVLYLGLGGAILSALLAYLQHKTNLPEK